MRFITKTLTLGSLLLSSQLLGPLAMASTELPGRACVQPLQSSLPEESFQTLLVSKLMARLGYDVQPAQEVDYNVAYASVAQGMAPSSPSTGYRCKTTSMSRRGVTRCSSVRAPMWPGPPRAISSTSRPRPSTASPTWVSSGSQAGGAV